MKKRITLKRILCAALAAVMLAAMPGCQQNAEPSNGGGAASGSQAEGQSGGSKEDRPTLIYYMISAGTANPDQLIKVQEKATEMIGDKIGANLEFHTVTAADVGTKIPLMLSSGENVDVVSNSGNFCSYSSQQQTGGLLELDELLPSVVPDLWNFYKEDVWNATRIQGKIFMVPCNNPSVSFPGVWVRGDLVDKYNFDWENTEKWEDWEPFFDAVLENEDGMIPMLSMEGMWGGIWFSNYYGYDDIGGVKEPNGRELLMVKADDPERKVVCGPFTPEYEENITLMRKWYEKGYVMKTPPTDDQFEIMKKTNGGAAFLVPFAGEWDTSGMSASEWDNKPIYVAKFKKNIINTGSITGSGLGVARASQHPEESLKFIQEMFFNKDLVNLLLYGIEGEDWEFKDKENEIVGMPEGVTADTIKYNANTTWQFGDCTLRYQISMEGKNELEKIQYDIENLSIYSVIMGFNADPSSMKNQIAAVANVSQEYGRPLEKGLVDKDDPDRGLAVYQQKLKEAGIDEIIAEYQRQIDEWAAENTK